MAGNVVGSLRVLLGLDAAEFTAGLTKADYQAQKFARAMREEIGSSVKDVVKIIGGLEIGRQLYENTKAIINEAASLNDLADATGSSVESLSRLNNQARIAGTDLGTLQGALLKLSQGMAGADEESTKTKDALRILGITTKDPVEALQQAAVKLNGYADGVNKVGLSVALFGKQGAAFTATLKDIAELQDVGATVSAKQAAEAENLQKQFARLSVEATAFKNAVLSDLVPALQSMIFQFTEGQRIAGGFLQALNLFGQIRVGDLPGEIARVSAALEDARVKSARFGGAFGQDAIANFEKQLQYLRSLLQRQAAVLSIRPEDTNVRDQLMLRKPEAPNPPGDNKKAAAIKEQTSETDRYIQSLLGQLQATLELSEVEKAQAIIYGLERNALSGLSEARRAEILDIAQQLDYAKEKKRVDDENKKNTEAAARERERYLDVSRRSSETAQREVDAIRDSVEATREQIIEITQGRDALAAYIAAKREKVAVEKEDMAATLEAVGEVDLAQRYRDAAAALRELNGASAGLRIADDIRKQAEAVMYLKGQAFDAVSRPIEDLIINGGKASDVLKQLERNLVAFITNQAFLGIKNFATGAPGGGDLFSMIFGKSGGGGFDVGQFLTLLGQGVGFMAGGGVSSGGLTVVGERGPEIVDLEAGARVYNAGDTQRMLGGSSVTVQQHFHVQGQVDSRTARNMAREAAGAVAAARGRG